MPRNRGDLGNRADWRMAGIGCNADLGDDARPCQRRTLLPFRVIGVAKAVDDLGRDLRRLLLDPMPADMAEEECSVVLLFRTSQVINRLTGGTGDMTFSARCHEATLTASNPVARGLWRVLEGAIDATCGAWRGECEHCAAAWHNHATRSDRSSR